MRSTQYPTGGVLGTVLAIAAITGAPITGVALAIAAGASITALGNVVVGEREAVLSAANRAAQGWDFADALHVALSQGCKDFATLDADLVKRAAREVAGGEKVRTVVARL